MFDKICKLLEGKNDSHRVLFSTKFFTRCCELSSNGLSSAHCQKESATVDFTEEIIALSWANFHSQ